MMDSTEQLIQKTCPVCGIRYAIPERIVNERRDDGESWQCPNGDTLVFTEPRIDKEKKKVEKLGSDLNRCSIKRHQAEDDAEYHWRRAAGLQGVITRWARRILNGACPVCGYELAKGDAIEDHIKESHPDFIERYGE